MSEVDQDKYTSPIPVIGVYTAAATLVCFLLMLYDISMGFHRKRPWLPCKFFRLNSFTLSLLSVATKLPVDLTTSMPRAQDQLSKLTSTTFICIYMGFAMPSLGIQRNSECLSNMAALTILVVTVIVDVCLQMSTGLIFLFRVEHIIVLVCMLVLLLVLWSSAFDISQGKDLAVDHNRLLLEKGLEGEHARSKTMIKRLKWCYIYNFSSNPQFILCQISHCASIGVVCSICFLSVSEAVLKILVQEGLNFSTNRGGECDYGYSVWMVVVIQIFTTLLGILAVGLRWITLVSHMNFSRFCNWKQALKCPSYWLYESCFGKFYSFPLKFSGVGFVNFFQVIENVVGTTLYVMQGGVVCANESIVFSCLLVKELFTWILRNCVKLYSLRFIAVSANVVPHLDSDKTIAEVQEVVYLDDIELEKWILSMGLKDMRKWIKMNKKSSPTDLIEILHTDSLRKQESLALEMEKIGSSFLSSCPYEYNLSSLSVVILIRMASMALPSSLTQALVHTLDEAFEIICFVDRKLNPRNFNNKAKSSLAEDIWMCRNITSHWFQKKFIKPSLDIYYSNTCSTVVDGDKSSQSSSELAIATGIIQELTHNSFGLLIPEFKTISEIVIRGEYKSAEELLGKIKQLFVDMLHYFLSKLPEAIHKDVIESPSEECEERVSLSLKFLCKLESLEDKIDWRFPNDSEITRLVTDNSPPPTAHNDETQDGLEKGEDTSIPPADGDVSGLITNLQFLLQTPNIAKQWHTLLSKRSIRKSMIKLKKV
ncbi:uncharacterized protein LOC113343921 [Papaver somniferum]|uniref:uncharacterized protein LOC113343921 n=1 Tax=Papaver somniferum TaxID=3469 RepID=UPI000E6FD721|nr:uncharacterized protein LOC113343921 [Papaver somniferum]